MTTGLPRLLTLARAALATHFGEPTGSPAAWRISLNHGANRELTATLDADWLILTCADAPPAGRDAQLREPADYAPDIKRAGARLVAEIPVIDPATLAQQVERVARAFPGPAADDARVERAPAGRHRPQYAAISAEAGWPPIERPDGRIDVQLECRRGFYQARLLDDGDTMRAVAYLREGPAAAGPVRDATERILRAIAAAVRLVRPVVELAPDGSEGVGFQVPMWHPPAPEMLARALGALSVAADACGPELALVSDPAWARHFLELGAARAAATTEQQPNKGNPT